MKTTVNFSKISMAFIVCAIIINSKHSKRYGTRKDKSDGRA